MAQKATADGGRIEPNYVGLDDRQVAVERDGQTVTVEFHGHQPRSQTVDLDRDGKTINRYTIVDKRGTSRSGSASSKSHHDRVHVLVRDGDEWTYVNLEPGMASPSRRDSAYAPAQLDGVGIKTEFNRRGGRGHESSYHKRVKIERELVESHDEVFLIQFREESGGARGHGDYHRIKNATATELTVDD